MFIALVILPAGVESADPAEFKHAAKGKAERSSNKKAQSGIPLSGSNTIALGKRKFDGAVEADTLLNQLQNDHSLPIEVEDGEVTPPKGYACVISMDGIIVEAVYYDISGLCV